MDSTPTAEGPASSTRSMRPSRSATTCSARVAEHVVQHAVRRAQDSRLRRAARDGDDESFAAIVRAFQDMAFGYAYALLGDFHLAEDAAQEAFVEAYLNLAHLREPAAFPGWLASIARNLATDHLRRRPADPVDLTDDLPARGSDAISATSSGSGSGLATTMMSSAPPDVSTFQ